MANNPPWNSFGRGAPAPTPPKPSQPFGGTLGVIAIALGVGVLGAYMFDLHSHVCGSCGHKWRHLGAFNMGDQAAHTCSKCGDTQWWKRGWEGGGFGSPPSAWTKMPPNTIGIMPPNAVAAVPQEFREVGRYALPSGLPSPRRDP